MKLLLNSRELAEMLGMPLTTVQQYASRFPDRLPPRADIPSRKIYWAVSDVVRWVDDRSKYPKSSEQAPMRGG